MQRIYSMVIICILLALSTQNTAAIKQIRVYVDMVADLFHYGHINFLKQAKTHGDYLIVGLTADEDVARYKRYPVLSVLERAKVVTACKYVDKVVPNCPYCVTEQFIKEHQIDLVIYGDDMCEEDLAYFYAVPIEMGIFKTVPYTPTISTTEILQRVIKRALASDITSTASR